MDSNRRIYPDAFMLHDQEGLSLTMTMMICAQKEWTVNLAAFACDALFAGWPEDKIKRTLEEGCADNGIQFNWANFRYGLAALWTFTGKKQDPECWKVMKEYLVRPDAHPAANG